jgi:hypothetical protein
MDTKLILPTNWDPELLPQAARFKPAYVYGALPREATVRSSLVLPEATEEDIAAQIQQAGELGIKFTYVMNATCLGNRELSENGRWEILQRLEWLRGVGGAAVVTANPYVMELARKNFPDLELQVSVLAAVDDPRKAKFFRDLGVDLIHIDPQINRDFGRLEAIRRAVDCRLSVVVNEGCLLSCPIRQYHANMISHSVEGIERRYYVDYCYYRCSLARNVDVVEYVRAPWIRPEDFFKIAGREKMGEGASSHTPWILKVAGAYHQRRCADVAELLVGVQPMERLTREALAPWRVRMSSSRLEGFLQFFRDGRCSLDCGQCGYCAEWAKACVTIEGDAGERVRELTSDLETLCAGSYWAGTQ